MADSIGARIKRLRMDRSLTLAGLGEKADLSTSYLSQIERDKTTPSLATLTVIARALDVGLRYFFESDAEAAFIVRSPAGEPAIESAARATRPQQLTPDACGNKLTASRVVVWPHASSGEIPTFAGEELVFLLNGRLAVEIGDERFSLSTGDSIHYDAAQPHCWHNPSDELCVIIWSRVASALDR